MKVYIVVKNKEGNELNTEYPDYSWDIEEIYLSHKSATDAAERKSQELKKDREDFLNKYKGQLDKYHDIINKYRVKMSESQIKEYIIEHHRCNWKYDIEYEVEEYEVKS